MAKVRIVPASELSAQRGLRAESYIGSRQTELVRSLRGMDFPSMRGELIGTAKKNGAGKDVISALQRFEDRDYLSMEDVEQEYTRICRSPTE